MELDGELVGLASRETKDRLVSRPSIPLIVIVGACIRLCSGK